MFNTFKDHLRVWQNDWRDISTEWNTVTTSPVYRTWGPVRRYRWIGLVPSSIWSRNLATQGYHNTHRRFYTAAPPGRLGSLSVYPTSSTLSSVSDEPVQLNRRNSKVSNLEKYLYFFSLFYKRETRLPKVTVLTVTSLRFLSCNILWMVQK